MNNPLQPRIERGIDWEALIRGITDDYLDAMNLQDESSLLIDLKDDDREDVSND
jgi:hypothetical protein